MCIVKLLRRCFISARKSSMVHVNFNLVWISISGGTEQEVDLQPRDDNTKARTKYPSPFYQPIHTQNSILNVVVIFLLLIKIREYLFTCVLKEHERSTPEGRKTKTYIYIIFNIFTRRVFPRRLVKHYGTRILKSNEVCGRFRNYPHDNSFVTVHQPVMNTARIHPHVVAKLRWLLWFCSKKSSKFI